MPASWFVAIELHVFLGDGSAARHIGPAFLPPGPAALVSARRRGLKTAVVAHERSYYGHAYDHLIDEWLVCDSRDPVAVAHQVLALPGEPAVVHSFVDTFVGTAAHVNTILGLRGANPEGAGLARNKARARQAVCDSGMEDVRFGTVLIGREELASPIGYPAIAKPVDGAASWDVRLVNNDAEVRRLAKDHVGRNYGRGVKQRAELVFEEYLEGPLWSVEGFVSGDGVEIFGWTDREQALPPDFAELSFGFAQEPPCIHADVWTRRVLAALQYDFGPFHLEAILTDSGLRLLELNPRLMGCGAHPCISLVTGRDVVDHVVGRLLGEPPSPDTSAGAATARLIVSTATGVVEEVEVERLAGGEGFVCAMLGVGPDDRVTSSLSSNAAHLGYVIAQGATRTEANTRARALADHVHITVVPVAPVTT